MVVANGARQHEQYSLRRRGAALIEELKKVRAVERTTALEALHTMACKDGRFASARFSIFSVGACSIPACTGKQH